MPGLEIRPFSDEHFDDAARLLAERHERHRAAEPLIPGDVDYRVQIEEALGAEGASGVAAITQGELNAYLVGQVSEDDRAVVDFAGHAAAHAELLRDLYADLAQAWVDAGCVRHAVYVPASDGALIDTWFRLGFGLQFRFAVRETSAEPPVDADLEIRPGTPDDREHAVAFDRVLWELQVLAPSFSGLTVPTDDEFREDWLDTWENADFTHFIAERSGRIVGHALLYRRPTGDLRIPEANIDLAHAATLPDVRGSGVGLALTAHVLAWAHDAGYRSMTTDWREVNLLSSRFWPRRGFRPTFLRLYRHIP
jgi:GNAT superfamily N-acetyltransferase